MFFVIFIICKKKKVIEYYFYFSSLCRSQMTHLLTWLPSWIFFLKASQTSLPHIYRRAPNAAGGLVYFARIDLPNIFAWVVSIHPYIHPVNGNGMCISLLVCQTTFKSTNIHHGGVNRIRTCAGIRHVQYDCTFWWGLRCIWIMFFHVLGQWLSTYSNNN